MAQGKGGFGGRGRLRYVLGGGWKYDAFLLNEQLCFRCG